MKNNLKALGGLALIAVIAALVIAALPARPAAAYQPIGVSTDQVSQLIAYDGSNRILYIGECLAAYQNRGSLLRWRIKKITYDGASTRITQVFWANNSSKFEHAWNLRATYTY